MPAANDHEPGAVTARELLMQMLASGNFSGGEALKESLLAREFGICRLAVREALCQAVGWGVAEYLPFKGYRVRNFSLGDLLDWCRLREGIEPIAARELARKRPKLMLAELEAVIAEENSAVAAADPRGVLQADLAFHLRLVSGCGNRCFASPSVTAYFPVIFNLTLLAVLELNYRDSFPLRPVLPGESFSEYMMRNVGGASGHSELLKLIAAGREEEAEQTIRAAIRKTGDEVEAMIEFYAFDRDTPINRLPPKCVSGINARSPRQNNPQGEKK